MQSCKTEPKKGKRMKSVKILAIGNSFSEDCMEHVYNILQDLGVEEIKLGNLCIGGCFLIWHCQNSRGDLPAYEYRTNHTGEWKNTPAYKMSSALEEREWDFIFTQQCSNHSGKAETYSDLDELMVYIKSLVKGNPTYGWHMTWAYAQGANHPAYVEYDHSQQKMYEDILNAVQTKIVPREDITRIIPSGTAIQNARAAIGDVLNRDGFHLTFDLGRYIAGLCVAKALVGLDIDNIRYAPEGVSDEQRKMAIAVVNAACQTPFAVTKI